VQQLVNEHLSQTDCDDDAVTLTQLTCSYCGRAETVDAMLTSDQRGYLERFGKALAEHVRYQMLSYVARTLSHNPQPTFVPVHPGQLPGEMRAEPDDMKIVPLICCGDEAKVASGWDEPYFCPRCGYEQKNGVRRRRVELSFIPE
jgi:hypothetical protein